LEWAKIVILFGFLGIDMAHNHAHWAFVVFKGLFGKIVDINLIRKHTEVNYSREQKMGRGQ
jgi:hypothetical protein